MRAGDLVYDTDLPETRREFEELLCEALTAILGLDTSDRLSNGVVADTLLQCLDAVVVTDAQLQTLRQFLSERKK